MHTYPCPCDRDHVVALQQQAEQPSNEPHLRLRDDRQNALHDTPQERLRLRLEVEYFSGLLQRVQQGCLHDNVKLREARNDERKDDLHAVVVEQACHPRQQLLALDGGDDRDERMGIAARELAGATMDTNKMLT